MFFLNKIKKPVRKEYNTNAIQPYSLISFIGINFSKWEAAEEEVEAAASY
jgi:hypothetical protein